MRWYSVGMAGVSLVLLVLLTGCDDIFWQLTQHR